MPKYLEHFHIPQVAKFSISKEDLPARTGSMPKPVSYQVWHGGCAIGNLQATIDRAREYLFEDAKQRIASRLAAIEAERQLLQEAKDRLGDDVFNLGRYLKDPEA